MLKQEKKHVNRIIMAINKAKKKIKIKKLRDEHTNICFEIVMFKMIQEDSENWECLRRIHIHQVY